MNNINGINGYQGPQAIQPQATVGANSQPLQNNVESGEPDDRVEISQIAQFMSQINALPEIRSDKVESIRQALSNESYDIDGRLSEALDLFLEENLGE